eukprot:TRINITY_DN8411_c0_g1_i5.p1 TRINITY_DN8411_c0_g1~~TRINITY_DN8411_c0_g1_i5.p1  ORF type:complete len:461 (-),score=105.63 TRINITY_DN8411_c0_g1_i5:29-1321(-)
MGSVDNNVPPFHMKRMARLVQQLSHNVSSVSISEVVGGGHWFDGIVGGAVMQTFFDQHVNSSRPPLPPTFVVTTLNPATTESRGGIRILQQIRPHRISRITVTRGEDDRWILVTENVRRFGFTNVTYGMPAHFTVDGVEIPAPACLPASHYSISTSTSSLSWHLSNDGGAWEATERGPSTYGPLERILMRPLVIVVGTSTSEHSRTLRQNWAIYMANTLYYQVRHVVAVIDDVEYDAKVHGSSNLVMLGGPSSNTLAFKLGSCLPSGLGFKDENITIGSTTFSDPSTGYAFQFGCDKCTSGDASSMCAIISGTDDAGFRKGCGLFPLSSTVMVPDYAVAGPRWGYAGAGGLLAAGFWDNLWRYDCQLAYVATQDQCSSPYLPPSPSPPSSSLPGWKTALIVLGSVGGAILVGVTVLARKYWARKKEYERI